MCKKLVCLIPLVVLVLALSATAQADVLLEDGFETNFDKWTDGGTTDWDRTTSQKHTGSYSAHCGSRDNDLISDNMNTSSSSSITIVLWYRDDDIDDKDNVYLKLYDGDNYDNKFELGNSTEDTWHQYEVTINNSGADAQYFHSTFRIKFEGSSIDRGENLWIDDVTVSAVSGPVDDPPTVSITSPLNGATVSGTVNVTADASDDVGVDKVEFYIDDVLKSTDTTSPYEYSWDTTEETDGSHGIKAKAYDTIGQTATDSINVTVDNAPAEPGAPLSSSSIMLQAFYWDCPQGWYSDIESAAPGLKSAGFTHFWFPPPCKGMGGTSSMGYDITDNYDLNTRFGGQSDLQAAAAATGNVLLDLVCNHMMGAAGQCQDSGNGQTYWQNYYYPHGTFEKNCSHFHPGYPDDCDLCNGLDYLMGEDVCHNSAYMFNGQSDWASWIKSTVGNVSGSRLDAVKHFSWDMSKELGTIGSCVGEYWDNKTNILNWISYTGNYAFDFPLYYTMQDSGAGALSGAGLCSTKGVSFVANHDADGISQKHRAYGYIMYIPSVPCVFWPHWFDSALQPSIQRAMDARNTYDFNGTFTVSSATNFIIFENNAPVFGCFNSAASAGSGTITVGPNITYTAVAWSGSQPADRTSDGNGNLTLTAPAKGYTYWYGGPGGGTVGGGYKSNYGSVAIPGTHNGWNPAGDPMTLIADWTWEGSISFSSGSEEYKFAMNGGWTVNRGLGSSSGPNLPQTVTNLTQDGANIPINVPNGTVVFTYHEDTESSTAVQQ